MAKFCTKCGAQLDDAAAFCPACGTPVAVEQAQQQAQQTAEQYQQQAQDQYQQAQQTADQYQQQAQGQYQQTQQQHQQYQQQPGQAAQNFQKAVKTNDYTASFHPNDIGYNKGYSVLCYLGLLTLIPYLSQRGKTSPYTRFHAVQGMYLMICEIALSIITGLLGLIKVPGESLWGVVLYYTTPWPIVLIQCLVSLAMLAFQVLGIVYAATGQAKDLPLICKMRKLGWFK